MDFQSALIVAVLCIVFAYLVIDAIRFHRQMRRWDEEDAAFRRMLDRWRRER